METHEVILAGLAAFVLAFLTLMITDALKEKRARDLYDQMIDAHSKGIWGIHRIQTLFGFQIHLQVKIFYEVVDKYEFRNSRMLEEWGQENFVSQYFQDVVFPAIREHKFFFTFNLLREENLPRQVVFPIGRYREKEDGSPFLDFDEGHIKLGRAIALKAKEFTQSYGCRVWSEYVECRGGIWDDNIHRGNMSEMSDEYIAEIRASIPYQEALEQQAVVILNDINKIMSRYSHGTVEEGPLKITYTVRDNGIEIEWNRNGHKGWRMLGYRNLNEIAAEPTYAEINSKRIVHSGNPNGSVLDADLKPGQSAYYMFLLETKSQNEDKTLFAGYTTFSVHIPEHPLTALEEEVTVREGVRSLQERMDALSEMAPKAAKSMFEELDEKIEALKKAEKERQRILAMDDLTSEQRESLIDNLGDQLFHQHGVRLE